MTTSKSCVKFLRPTFILQYFMLVAFKFCRLFFGEKFSAKFEAVQQIKFLSVVANHSKSFISTLTWTESEEIHSAARKTQGYAPIQRWAKQNQTSDFLSHLKVNRDNHELINRQWKRENIKIDYYLKFVNENRSTRRVPLVLAGRMEKFSPLWTNHSAGFVDFHPLTGWAKNKWMNCIYLEK